jgi:hypothetical protein
MAAQGPVHTSYLTVSMGRYVYVIVCVANIMPKNSF